MVPNKYIGDKSFYKKVIAIALPIMLQNAITNFVNLLDNIMIGSVGAEQLSAVAVSNQLIFVFNLCVFGIVSGAGIFTAQFYGRGDDDGVRNTMRLKLMLSAAITVIVAICLAFFDRPLVSLWMNDDNNPERVALTLSESHKYLMIIIVGLFPTFVTHCYSDTLRSSGETVVPMKAGAAALVVNFALNYVLIFGIFGMKGLGVVGAAIATVTAKFVECAYIVTWTHRRKAQHKFADGLYKTFRVPSDLAASVAKTGFPLMLNETLWGLGITVLNQAYSLRGLEAVDAVSISSTMINMFNVAVMALGSAVGIIVGRDLGAGDLKRAREDDTRMLAITVAVSTVMGAIVFAAAPLLTLQYKVSPDTAATAVSLIRISAVLMPINGFLHSSYFTLRSGGKTVVTFLFDSAFVWCIVVPTGFIIGRYTSLPVVPFVLACQSADLIKAVVGFILVKKGIWLNDMVGDSRDSDSGFESVSLSLSDNEPGSDRV